MIQGDRVVFARELARLIMFDAIDRGRNYVFDERPILRDAVFVSPQRTSLPSDRESRSERLAALWNFRNGIDPMVRFKRHEFPLKISAGGDHLVDVKARYKAHNAANGRVARITNPIRTARA